MKLRYLLVACGFWLLLAPGLSAQRPDYFAVRDSIAQLDDLPLLRRMERAVALPGAAPTAEPLVRRGLIALRLWELTKERDEAERSRDLFETAVARFPAEAWSHYGLALALAHGPDARLPFVGGLIPQVTLGQTVAELFGRDARSRARRALRQALRVDPAFGAAAALLADLALADGRNHALVSEARQALLAVRAAGDDSPRAARALAEIETALGNFAAAADATATTTEDPGVLRTRAIALLLQDGSEDAGYAVLERAIERLDRNTAAQFRADIATVVNAQEIAEWGAADGLPQQRLFLQRFWERRAAESGVLPAERVAEHYRRLQLARASYVRNARRGSENSGALLGEGVGEEHIFDDRGVVLIRHGLPQQVVANNRRGLLPNETWVYALPGQDQVLFHFVAIRGAQDFTLVNDLLEAVDRSGHVPASERQAAIYTLLEGRATVEPAYRTALNRLRRILAEPNADLEGTELRSILERPDAAYRQAARRALRTDSFRRTWAEPLAFHSDIFTFRTPFARTDVTAAFAIPTDQLEAVAGSGGREFALELSLILTDTLQDLVTRLDTTRFVRLPAAGERFVRTHVTMPVVPSEHTIFRLVAADAIGGAGGQDEGGVRLRDYSSNRLQLSDVVLAVPDSAGDWQRGQAALALVLPRSFGADRPFTVFYEVYNLPAETAYLTEVTVAPVGGRNLLQRIFGGGRDRIRLRFEGVARPDAEGVMQEIREVASDLPAGRYRLDIEVTNRATGETAGTGTEFTVLE